MKTLSDCLTSPYENTHWMECPNCSGGNIHHYTVEVYEREEDAKTGLHVTVEHRPEIAPPPGLPSESAVKTDFDMAGNPSTRRHGVRIWFWCEHCEDRFALDISQNKGLTVVRLTPEDL